MDTRLSVALFVWQLILFQRHFQNVTRCFVEIFRRGFSFLWGIVLICAERLRSDTNDLP